MERNLLKTAGKLYGRTVLATLLNLFVYLSINMLFTVFADPNKQMTESTALIANIVALVFQVGIFTAMIYSDLWGLGDRDRNAVQFGHLVEDKQFGLKAGCVASVPAAVSFLLLVADKALGLWAPYATLYRVAHLSFYPIVVWSFGKQVALPGNVLAATADIPWVGILTAGIPVLLLPLIAWFSYRMGYAQIAVKERLVYGKEKKK